MIRSRCLTIALLLAAGCWSGTAAGFQAEGDVVDGARTVLNEVMAIPGKKIPEALLADAKGVAIIPNVIKIGFVAGVRFGRGVVLVRDANGGWGLPKFVEITGGSVGWQIGAQATDVVLVFRTQKSVDGLGKGKFTIGADAAASAGPVGRNLEAATDAQLRAEIYSYSRSRGLFAGVALDGSVLHIDEAAGAAYYGNLGPNQPSRVPESAVKLVELLNTISKPGAEFSPPAAGAVAEPNPGPQQTSVLAPNFNPQPSFTQQPTAPADINEATRVELVESAKQLGTLLDDGWRRYLALPSEAFDPKLPSQPGNWQQTLKAYQSVLQKPDYRALADRPEFQKTYGLVKRYAEGLAPAASTLNLPPPPPDAER